MCVWGISSRPNPFLTSNCGSTNGRRPIQRSTHHPISSLQDVTHLTPVVKCGTHSKHLTCYHMI